MFSFVCNININTRIVVGIGIVILGCVCIYTHKSPAYWPIVGIGILAMVGGKIGNIDIKGGGGRDKGDKK